MTTDAGAEMESREFPGKRRRLAGHDIAGIVMGVPVFLLGLLALPGIWWVGASAVLVSLCLFIPGRVYEHRTARVIGFLALALTIAISMDCTVVLGLGAYSFLSDPPEDGEMRWIMAAVTMFWCLIALVFTLGCMSALLKKLEPKPACKTTAIAVGIAVGLVNTLLVYLVYLRD